MRRGTRARGTVALSAVIALLGAGIAQADVINNNISNTLPLDGTRKVQPYTAGSAAVAVGFRVLSDGNCDATSQSPLYLQISPPTGVTAASSSFNHATRPRTLTFTNCSNGTNNTQSVSFSSAATLTPNDYVVDGTWTDPIGTYTNNAPFTLRVQAPAQSAASTTLAVSNASAAYDAASVTLSATLSSGTSKVSGKSVSFKVAGVTVGSGTTDAQGVATYDYALDKTKPVAAYDLQATWAGDATHASSNSTVGSLAVTMAAQSISFTAPSPKTFGGGSFTVSPTATSGRTVSVASSTPSVCTVADGQVDLTGAGTCTLTATQPGDANWAAATAVPHSFTVARANQTIIVGFTPATAKFTDAPVTYSASSSGLTVTKSVTSGPCTLSGDQLTLTGAGDCVVTASQIGNTNYNPATEERTLTIAKANQTINFTAPTGEVFGNDPFALGGSSTSGEPVSYTVNSGPCTVAVDGTLTITGAGDCVVTASQAGSDNYNPASDVQQTIEIAKADQTINFTAPTGKVFGNDPFALGGSSTSGEPVSYTVNSGPCTVAADGTLTITGAGDCTVTASQAGNSNYNAANNEQRTFTIQKAAQSITFLAPMSKTYGDAAFALGGSASSNLTVSYGVDSGPCTVADGTLTITGASQCTVTASQAGNSNYDAASNVSRTFTIAPKALTGSFTAADKLYDGTATAFITSSSLSGVVTGDAVTLNGSAATAAFADPAVGTGKTVTSTGFTLAGADAANYSLTMNTTTASIQPWTFKGFYQPVDMNSVVNTVKAGATVPFKFEMFKAATELTDTASIKSLTAKTINCATTTTFDDIELTATGGTSLRYDATAGQYVYNWQTPKTIGTCYAVTISGQDGTGATAYFKTK